MKTQPWGHRNVHRKGRKKRRGEVRLKKERHEQYIAKLSKKEYFQ